MPKVLVDGGARFLVLHELDGISVVRLEDVKVAQRDVLDAVLGQIQASRLVRCQYALESSERLVGCLQLRERGRRYRSHVGRGYRLNKHMCEST